MKDLQLRVRAVVRISDLKISRRSLADYVKEMELNACCIILFPHPIIF